MSTLMRVATAALLLLSGSIAAFAAPAPVVLNVRDFGATGDGVTDDLDAMQAAAAALCSSPAGSRLVYPPGTYLIDQHRVFRGPAPNGVDDVVYNNCNGVTISGYGATIDVKGDFHMNADFFDEQWFSYSKQVTPFFMLDSSDFIIEGFEMYGNVDKMTKDAGVIEDNCAGIVTRRCSRYLLRDMDIHHFSVDAIELGWLDFGDDFITDKDARIENVSCHHNGRTAMAIVHVRRAWIVDSSFNHAGHTEGAFGDFNPQAGIDIEPDFTTADGVDMHTGEIYFINTTWRGNKGPELLAAFPGRVETTIVHRSNIVREPGGYPGAYGLAFAPKTGVLEHSTVDVREGLGAIMGPWGTGTLSQIVGVTYANNLFRLSTNGGLVVEGAAPFDFVDNEVQVTAAASDGTFMDLRSLRRISGNRFFVDGAGSIGTNGQIVIRTNGTPTVLRNEYRTNLNAAGQTFATSYGNADSVLGELFPNAPNFRPAGTTNWNATSPYRSAAPATSDTTQPVISNIAAVQLSTRTLISWLTDEAANSVVEYGTSPAYGNTAQLSDLSRYHPVFLTDLTLGATYHYRVRSTDAAGNTRVSSDRTFTAPATRPPTVTTGAASAITATTATLNGTVNPGGMSATTLFEYGIDTTYGSVVPAQTRTGTTTQAISANIAASCGTTYHFRARAETSLGVRYGDDRSFVAAPCPCTSFTIAPASANPSSAAGQQAVTITGAPAGCQGGNWTATENSSWLTVSPAAGNGPGSVTVSWTSNEADTPRSATATIAGNAFAVTQAANRPISKALSDFDGDGKSDILWYHSTTGETYLWTMDGPEPVGFAHVAETADLNWKIAGTGDFDGNGTADVLWRHATTGENYGWLMDGEVIAGAGTISIASDTNWKIVGTADYDGDGKSDVLWRHATSGENYMYLMDGLDIPGSGVLPSRTDTRWTVAGSPDLDGDGNADIVWRHSATGQVSGWLMNGLTRVASGVIATVDLNWTIAGTGDFDGDTKGDLFWRHKTTGENYLYLMDGLTRAGEGSVNDVTDLQWKIAAFGDYNGDGMTDLVWRHAVTGDNYIYLMDGMTITAATDLPSVAEPQWSIVR